MSSKAIVLVLDKAKELAQHSWEYGVISQSLLELYNPELSVYAKDPATLATALTVPLSQATGLEYARQFICTDKETIVNGEG